MKNNQRDGFQGLFNLLILLSFGMFAILIKVLKHTSEEKIDTPKNDPKTPTEPIKKEIKEEPKKISIPEGLNERQEIIIRDLIERGEITPKELKKIIPDVSTRTIRRDMDKLVEKGLVTQEGSTKSTYYKYKA